MSIYIYIYLSGIGYIYCCWWWMLCSIELDIGCILLYLCFQRNHIWIISLLTSLFLSTRKSTVHSLKTSKLLISSRVLLLLYASWVFSKSMDMFVLRLSTFLVWLMRSTSTGLSTTVHAWSTESSVFSSWRWVDATVDRSLSWANLIRTNLSELALARAGAILA